MKTQREATNMRQPMLGRSVSRYAAQRRAGFRTLRFAPDLEQQYRASYTETWLSRFRLFNMLGVGAVYVFVVLDRFGANLLTPDAEWALLWIGAPTLGLPVLFSFWLDLRRVFQPLQFITLTIYAYHLIFVIAHSQTRDDFPYESLLMLTFYAYFGSGLTQQRAVSCGVLMMVSYGGVQLWLDKQGADLPYEIFYFLVANMLGAFARYFLEHQDRQTFLIENELRLLAEADGLTGVYNRRAFRRHLRDLWRKAQQEKAAVGLLLIDMDNLKPINDSHGHHIGDYYLCRLAETLNKHRHRPDDAIGRLGGDEFAGVWYAPSQVWFEGLPALLRAEATGINAGAGTPTMSFGVGLVFIHPQPGDSADEYLRLTDRRLYRDKEVAARRARGDSPVIAT